jgi:hypothetical protein
MTNGPAQIASLGYRIVVQKIDEVTVSRFKRGVSLRRGLTPARDNDLQLPGRVIKRLASRHGLDLGLAGPRRD